MLCSFFQAHKNGIKKMIKGSCLCGKVTFEISGEPSSLSYCHCSRCRKAAGVFSAVVIGKARDLHLRTGEDVIGRYKDADSKFERCFCKECGTSLGDMSSGEIYVMAASALDDDPKVRPSIHIHTASKPDWYEIKDDLVKFEGDYIPPQ
jgi:hypothetical protein